MAWDKKANGQGYFYLSRRCGPKTKKVYLGHGPAARMAANRIALHRAERKAQAEAWQAAASRWADIAGFRNELLAGVQFLTAATLLAAGFHRQSRHQWRRRQYARET